MCESPAIDYPQHLQPQLRRLSIHDDHPPSTAFAQFWKSFDGLVKLSCLLGRKVLSGVEQ